MSKKQARKPRNTPGDEAHQPTEAEQAEGVTTSAASPRPERGHGARLESLEAKVHQLCIKVGI